MLTELNGRQWGTWLTRRERRRVVLWGQQGQSGPSTARHTIWSRAGEWVGQQKITSTVPTVALSLENTTECKVSSDGSWKVEQAVRGFF